MNQSSTLSLIQERLDGPRWYFWSFAAGLAIVGVTAAILSLIALGIGHDPMALTMFGLMVELVVISMVGSGMLDSVSNKVSTGDFGKSAAEIEAINQRLRHNHEISDEEKERIKQEEKDRKDRRTLRAGLIVAPILAAFLGMLFYR